MDLTDLLRFHIAPGADPGGDPALWQWEDRTEDVRAEEITITGGRADELGQVDTTQATFTLDNTDGHYCTRNPLGRWHGALARNCPVRLGTISGAHAFTTNASNGFGTPDVGTSWSVDGTASTWSVSSGMARKAFAAANSSGAAILNGADARNGEATFVASSPVVATGSQLIVGFFCRRSSAGNLLFTIEFGLAGQVVAKIRRAVGITLTELGTVTLGFTYTANERIKARCEWDGADLRMRVWEEAGSEPTTWDVTGTDQDITGSQVGLFFWRTNGNTNAGTVTLAADDLEVEAVEFTGTVAEWPVRWDPTGTVSWAPVTAAGILRRLAQGSPPLRSPLYRQLISRSPTGYWPLEDGAGATVAASALPGNPPAQTANVTFSADASLPGSAGGVQLQDVSSLIKGVVRQGHGSTGFSAMLLFKMATLPVQDGTLIIWQATGRIVNWRLMVGAINFKLVGYDSDGTEVFNVGSGIYTVDPLQWTAIQLETDVVGANTEWDLLWHQVGASDFYFASGSFASTVVSHIRGFALGNGVSNQDTVVSHVWAGPNTLPFVAGEFAAASNGYIGELAADRVARLCEEEGIPVVVEDGDTEVLGAQRVASFVELLRSAEAADSGVLYEQGASLGYRPRGARYDRPVTFDLDVAAEDVSDPAPEPTDDDQRVRNQWSVGRDGGSEATVTDDAHVALHGLYADSATINVATDDVLPDHAGWRTHLGTWPELRWPSLTLNFTDRPDLLALWRGRPFGARLTAANMPAEAGEDPDVIVEGWTQTITSHSWTVTLNCSPARPWDVGLLDDGAIAVDADCVLAEDLTTVETAVDVTTTDGPWDSTAVPFDIDIGGERMTVTAISGTGAAQTLTVTRAVNGVVKTHATGAAVGLWSPTYVAL